MTLDLPITLGVPRRSPNPMADEAHGCLTSVIRRQLVHSVTVGTESPFRIVHCNSLSRPCGSLELNQRRRTAKFPSS